MDGDEVETSVLAVDVGHKFAHKPFEFRRIGQSGARHLNHDDVANPFRVILQQFFKRTELTKIFGFTSSLGEKEA